MVDCVVVAAWVVCTGVTAWVVVSGCVVAACVVAGIEDALAATETACMYSFSRCFTLLGSGNS